ncbi:MAG: flagellar biosynthetic protein FliO [Proteobacteria bacterium]|nr:flagellar biosynthetic protein FliO [Pseudomonadota bacterium]MBI3497220.1 flagellar biosynthetic protein FliO [Pseudomonadota bacterium]
MSALDFLRFFSALVFVLSLIGALAWLVRRFGLAGRLGAPRSSGRLAVVEVAALDARRRLVLVRRDSTEHLLLLGGTSEIVVESGISRPSEDFGASLSQAGGQAIASQGKEPSS